MSVTKKPGSVREKGREREATVERDEISKGPVSFQFSVFHPAEVALYLGCSDAYFELKELLDMQKKHRKVFVPECAFLSGPLLIGITRRCFLFAICVEATPCVLSCKSECTYSVCCRLNISCDGIRSKQLIGKLEVILK